MIVPRLAAFASILTAFFLAGCGESKPKDYGIFVREGSRLARLEPRVSAEGSVISAQGALLIHERILAQPGAEKGYRVFSRSLIGRNIDLVMASDGQTITQVLTEPAGGSELFGDPLECDMAPVPGEREMVTLRPRAGWKPGLYALQPPGEEAAPLPFAVDIQPAALATHPAVGRMDRYFEVRPGGPNNTWADFNTMSQRGVGGDQRRNGRFILKSYYRPAGSLENDARQWLAAADRALNEGRVAAAEVDLRRAEAVLGKDAGRGAKLTEARTEQERKLEEQRQETARRAAQARQAKVRKLITDGQPALALVLVQSSSGVNFAPKDTAAALELAALTKSNMDDAKAALEEANRALLAARQAAQARRDQEGGRLLWEGDCSSVQLVALGSHFESPAHARLTASEFILKKSPRGSPPSTVRWAVRDIRSVNGFQDSPPPFSNRREPYHVLVLKTDRAEERLHFPSPAARQPLFDQLKKQFDVIRAQGDTVADERHGLERLHVGNGIIRHELTASPLGWSAPFRLPTEFTAWRLNGPASDTDLQIDGGSPIYYNNSNGGWNNVQSNGPTPGAQLRVRSRTGKEHALQLEVRVEG